MKTKSTLISIAALLLLIISISLLIMLQSSKKYYNELEKQIEERNTLIKSLFNDLVLDNTSSALLESLCLNDSIAYFSTLPQKVSDAELRKITELIQNYIEVINIHDSQGYAELFAKEVPKFFLQDSVSNKDVYNHMQWYWKTYPDIDLPTYSVPNMSIVKNPSEFIVFLPSKKGDTEHVTEIRFNKDLKIFYIRDYYAYIKKRSKGK